MTEAASRRPGALLAADVPAGGSAIDDAGQTGIERQDANQPKSAAARRKKKPGPRCNACGQPIDPPTGYAYVSIAAAQLRDLRYREWVRNRLSGGVVTGPPPERVAWWFCHVACSDADPRRVFTLPLAQMTTDRQLLEIALSLSYHKTLASHSAWQAMLRAVADARRRG